MTFKIFNRRWGSDHSEMTQSQSGASPLCGKVWGAGKQPGMDVGYAGVSGGWAAGPQQGGGVIAASPLHPPSPLPTHRMLGPDVAPSPLR